MRRRRLAHVALIGMALGTCAAAPASPAPPPAFRLYRTANAAHLAAGTANPAVVLLIGSDIREGDPATGRADSLHLATLNVKTMRGTIIGIPRDSFVDAPGFGRMKITESLYHGGPELTVRSVEAMSGIKVHYWALVEFSRFRALVDRLGGVDLDMPHRMADANSGAYFDAGRRHLNGAEALAFARNRYDATDGDFGRSLNQGHLLLAGLAKFRAEAGDPFGLLRYLDAFGSLVASNVPVRELLVLGSIARRVDPSGIRNVVLPGRAGTAGPASVVFLDASARTVFDAVRDDGEL